MSKRDFNELDLALREMYRIQSGSLALNFILSDDGVFAIDNSSRGLTNPTDRLLFHYLRSQADLIIVGANSVRHEPYANHSQPVLTITNSGELPDAFFTGSRPIVLTGADSQSRVRKAVANRADILVMGGSRANIAKILPRLHERGFNSLLCEGGAELALELAGEGLVDDLFLTTTHRFVASEESIEAAELIQDLELVAEYRTLEATYQHFTWEPERASR